MFKFEDKYEIYCLSHNNPKRRKMMETKFKTLDISANFYDGISFHHQRIQSLPEKHQGAASCFLGHLDSIENFYKNTKKDYGIFCEDDIYIHIDFKEIMEKVYLDLQKYNIHLLLLGYLLDEKITSEKKHYLKIFDSEHIPNYTYFNYHFNLWGSQMFLMSREQAKYILDRYNSGIDEADKWLQLTGCQHLSADHVFTKDVIYGRKVLIYPMVAVEYGIINSDIYGQVNVHRLSRELNYDPNIHI